MIEILREGPQTAWYIAAHMKWSRSWDDIAGFMRRAAVGETVSHLRVLELDGTVRGRGRRAGPLVAGRARRGLSARRRSGAQPSADTPRARWQKARTWRAAADRVAVASRVGVRPAAAHTTD